MSTIVEEIEKTKTSSEDTKDRLLLDSLEIKGYRCFEHLTIEKLGRVNLIVGKNNVGKTALLEALWIYAQGGHEMNQFLVSTKILLARNERIVPITTDTISSSFLVFNPLLVAEESTTLKHLFYNYPTTTPYPVSFQIGSFNDNKKVVKINFQFPTQHSQSVKFETETVSEFWIKNEFISQNGLTLDILTALWDKIALTDLQKFVVESLRIISPTLIDIGLISYALEPSKRIPIARTENYERVPLRSLGEGMNRLLGIALALVNCEDGVLLLDEIESGLHYSILPDVWKLIFKTAKDLNVQVFATTHSKDCVEAFAQAAYDSPEDGMLIRLERHDEKIVAKTIEEEMLVDAVNYEVEVR